MCGESVGGTVDTFRCILRGPGADSDEGELSATAGVVTGGDWEGLFSAGDASGAPNNTSARSLFLRVVDGEGCSYSVFSASLMDSSASE